MHSLVLLVAAVGTADAGVLPANTWNKLTNATIVGKRWDVPLGYAPHLKRFMILGGRTSFGDYKQPRSYDVLALDEAKGWENWFPNNKDWGTAFGPCLAPRWKDEHFHFRDVEGNTRPNWTVYGTFSLGQLYDYDPDTKAFYFYTGGRTFRYDPHERTWQDLNPPTTPAKDIGILLWSSMVYDRHNKVFVLFGGGNMESKRGDPGTWIYSPAKNTWSQLHLDVQPPQRANSRLAYDPTNKKIVLFGGDQLDQLVADTWTFDVVTQQWQQQKPARSPAPRGGHALVWLPKSNKIALVGGYTYTSAVGYVEGLYRALPFETWIYDVAANRWDLLAREDPKTGPRGPANVFLSAAVNDQDEIVALADGVWKCSLDVSQTNEAAAARFGVAPGTITRREGPHDPQWYRDVPAADPKKVEEELKSLPVNQWVLRPTPKLPRPNMDWGSAVFSPEHDVIMRFSGGHSAYSGTAPQVYDVKTDRYSIPFAPEYPLEYVYSNDQVDGEWSFKGNPWMTGHTYKSTGYDPRLKSLVFAPHGYTYFFDPTAGRWSRSEEKNPYQPNFYIVTVCTTPEGAVVWAKKRSGGAGLWRLDAERRNWVELPLSGNLPEMSPDHHGMAYDSRRQRLLCFSDMGSNKGDVAAYDLKSGAARWLNAEGKKSALVHCRETTYIPHDDLVLIGAHVRGKDGQMLWAAFDCARDAWCGLHLTGADPIGKGTSKTAQTAFNNSMGLMFDPNRQLIWAVGQNSHVHVLKVDAKSVRREYLE